MSSRVILSHHTRYRYDRPVSLGRQTVRLCPVSKVWPLVRHYGFEVSPEGADIVWRQDSYGNRVAEISFSGQVRHFDISVNMDVDLSSHSRPSPERDLPDDAAYQTVSGGGERLAQFVSRWQSVGERQDVTAVEELNRAIAGMLVYQRRLEPGVWSPGQTLERGSGSCRDSAWLLVTVLRHLGIPARFVSGYLVQPEGGQAKGAQALGGLSCDLHAWAEAWIEGKGWVGFDTTSGLIAAQHHIPLAVAGRPEETAPVSGMLDRCEATFDVTMQASCPVPGHAAPENGIMRQSGGTWSHEAV